MKLIDLTQTFESTMPVYPGDPPASLTLMDKGECKDHLLNSGMHVGTHIDAPLHMIEGGEYLSDIAIDRFIGKGHLIDARGKTEISEELLEGINIGKGDIVLIMTGFASKFGLQEYYDAYPAITEGFARRLVAAGASIVGMDTPSPDRSPYAVHKILLGQGTLIIENLTKLEELVGVEEFMVYALPAKMRADAGMVRVVASVL